MTNDKWKMIGSFLSLRYALHGWRGANGATWEARMGKQRRTRLPRGAAEFVGRQCFWECSRLSLPVASGWSNRLHHRRVKYRDVDRGHYCERDKTNPIKTRNCIKTHRRFCSLVWELCLATPDHLLR